MLERGTIVTIDELELLRLQLGEAIYLNLLMQMFTYHDYDASDTVIKGTVNNFIGEGRYEVTFDIPERSTAYRELETDTLSIIIAIAYINVLEKQEGGGIRLVSFIK
jgi:hypothetical protein